MPRYFDKHLVRQRLDPKPQVILDLADWLSLNVTNELAARSTLEATWRKALKRYEGVPKKITRDVPIENAPNIHITIGATACDTLYAQVTDLIFEASPLVTCRAKAKGIKADRFNDAVSALQEFANHLAVSPDVGLYEAAENALLDNIQLGSGFLYVPWVENTRKTKTAKVLYAGPVVRAVAPEDIIVTLGTKYLSHEMPIFGLNLYYSELELRNLAKINGWDVSNFKPMSSHNWVRQRREALGRQPGSNSRINDLYCVQLIFCYYDIDEDGYEEDLLVIYNHDSETVGFVSYNPMDRRPIEKMVYQKRPHMYFGLGVMDMLGPYEEKLTDVHNYATLNILLANARVWAGDSSVPDDLIIYPGMVLNTLTSADSLKPLQMADVYNSIWQDQNVVMGLANQRVGISSAMSSPEVPKRTAGITTMSMLQQVNRRFTPAFKGMRNCISNAIKQCIYRYQEQILAGNEVAKATILEVLGERGLDVIELLNNEHFDEQVDVELTASSASVNREADKQNAIMLVNLLGQYTQRSLELAQVAANPQVPEGIRNIAVKAAEASTEIIKRTIRTFDSIRDPETFVLEIQEEMNTLQENAGVTQEQMVGLVQNLLAGQGQSPLELPERTMI